MIQRFDRDTKGFRYTWVVGLSSSGKTQLLNDICLTQIQNGQNRYRKPKHTDRIRPNILVPIFASVPYRLQTKLDRGLVEEDDVFSSLIFLTIQEYAVILDELKMAYSNDKLKKTGKFFKMAQRLDDDGVNARGEIYNISHLCREGTNIVDTWFGRYLDKYEKRGEDWKIIERVCVHNGTQVMDSSPMPMQTSAYRRGSFDRPANGRLLGP